METLDLEYMLGGSIALWAWGQMRTTMDVDVVVNLPLHMAEPLSAELLKHRMMVPADIIQDLILGTRGDLAINAIDGFSGNKAEFFPLREGDELRAMALARRQRVRLRDPIGEVYVHSPEDLILDKLKCYSISRQTKHNRDIGSILASGRGLDVAYIEQWAARLGVLDIWREFLAK